MIVFFILAAVAAISGILMITRANPVNSALLLILNFISLAGIYLTLNAQFVAIIQILVYAGAIMVLVLFVIMLLNLQDEGPLREELSKRHYANVFFALAVLALIIEVLGWQGGETLNAMQQMAPNAVQNGMVQNIGDVLFTSYVFPFEVTSILLLAAMIGAVVLAKKRFP
ncbi:MAG: NADH-quinone oxidoreductase subunit J [Ignavibacteria bacterium]|nr:MAG: NADH-quinone oxidoreductase subunit J [Ignavibacteria bacterium]